MGAKEEISELVKTAYDPKYATKNKVGTLGQNWEAIKSWFKGMDPGKIVRTGGLTTSVSAPTIVDLIRGKISPILGGKDPYGHRVEGKKVSAEEFDRYLDGLPSFVLHGNGAKDLVKMMASQTNVNKAMREQRKLWASDVAHRSVKK